jgi:hypothetical protein
VVCMMSIDGLMPPNSSNMTGMIRRFSAYELFAQHSRFATSNKTRLFLCNASV